MLKILKSVCAFIAIIIGYKVVNLLLPETTNILAIDPFTAVAGALALGRGILGSTTTQQGNQQQFTRFRPEDLAAIEAARTGVVGGTQNLLDQLTASRGAIQSGMAMPTTGFQFAQTPDAYSRAMASYLNQGTAQQAGAQQRSLAQQFRGPVGQILGRQAEMTSRLQQNPALFQVFQQQQARELAQSQQQMAQTQAANQALLGREQALASLAGTGLSAQGNLLAQQLGLGQAFGTNISEARQRTRSK